MEFANNIALNTDSYKVTMDRQYPPGTEYIYSYAESRGGRYGKTVWYGLQAYIKEYLLKPVTMKQVDHARAMWNMHFGNDLFPYEGWKYIVEQHGGLLPVRIESVPEGEVVPMGIPLLSIVNTDPKVPWLSTWLEQSLLRAIWYPTTVATRSNMIRGLIVDALEQSGTPEDIDFKLHDFGGRGASSFETAAIGGSAHLVNFKGTDTMQGAMFAREYYGEVMAGFSIPASEHSTITSWGRDREVDAYRNMLNAYPEAPVIACVSDSYNIFDAVHELWGKQLRQEVIDSGRVVVIRPDSGDPLSTVLKVIELAAKQFGYTTNDKGYKVLNHVRVIQGDGVNEDTISKILQAMLNRKWSADNIAFGMGGALLQGVDRDTQKFALKCSAAFYDGKWNDVYKSPIGDKGKHSKAGRVVANRTGSGEWFSSTIEQAKRPMFQLVFENGKLYNETTFAEIRERATA